MAVELAPQGIRVNSVAPTFIETPLTKPMLANPDFMEFVKRMIPMGKIGKPEDVAAAVLYLCSGGAGMVTGHSLGAGTAVLLTMLMLEDNPNPDPNPDPNPEPNPNLQIKMNTTL